MREPLRDIERLKHMLEATLKNSLALQTKLSSLHFAKDSLFIYYIYIYLEEDFLQKVYR